MKRAEKIETYPSAVAPVLKPDVPVGGERIPGSGLEHRMVPARVDERMRTMGFFLHLLEHRALKQARPLKGKFRSFLLASFQNFILDETSKARCLKRGGNREFVFLDAKDAESRYLLEPADFLTAEKIYDARWAMTLLGRAVERLRQEYATRNEMSRFAVLQLFVGDGEDKTPP